MPPTLFARCWSSFHPINTVVGLPESSQSAASAYRPRFSVPTTPVSSRSWRFPQCLHSGKLHVSLAGPIANPTTRHLDFCSLVLSQLDSKFQLTGGSLPPSLFALLFTLLFINVRKDLCRAVGFAIEPDRLTGSVSVCYQLLCPQPVQFPFN
jgi:hypothetical protein